MNEPVCIPILLDVDIPDAEELEIDNSMNGYDIELETPFVIPGKVVERGLPPGGLTGDLLAKSSDANYAAEWITPANAVEKDNTRPITAAAVYTEVGNINALLATI